MGSVFAFALALIAHPGLVTFYAPGTRLAPLLEELGSVTGTVYVCDASLANEVVLVSVHGVEESALESKLAKVLGGRWEDVNGKKQLTLDRALDKTERVNAKERRLDLLQKEIARFASDLDKPFEPGVTPEFAIYPKDRLSPLKRALFKVLTKVTRRDLAKAMDHKSVSFFWPPRPGSEALPVDADDLLADLCKETQEWAPYLRNRGTPEQSDVYLPGTSAKATSFVTSSVVGLKFTVSPGQSPAGCTAKLNIEFRDPSTNTEVSEEIVQWDTSPAKSSLEPVSFELSDESLALLTLMIWQPGRSPGTTAGVTRDIEGLGRVQITFHDHPARPTPILDEAIRTKFLHPEDKDPLRYFPSEMTLAALDGRDQNVVAVLPDSLLTNLAVLLDHPTKTFSTRRLLDLIAGGYLTTQRDLKWSLLWPTDRPGCRDRRMDRKDLGDGLREADQVGSVRFKIQSRLARTLTVSDMNILGIFKVASGQSEQLIRDQLSNPAKFELWQQLGPDQAPMLAKSGKLNFVVSNGRDVIAATNAFTYSETVSRGMVDEFSGPLVERLSYSPWGNRAFLTQLETSSHGTPNPMQIPALSKASPALRVLTKNPLDRCVLTIAEYALDQVRSELPNLQEVNPTVVGQVGLQPLQKREYILAYEISSGVFARVSLSEFAAVGLGIVKEADGLPPSHLAELSTLKSNMTNNLKDLKYKVEPLIPRSKVKPPSNQN